MVEPTNPKPRRFKSALKASDSSVLAGMSLIARGRFCNGRPPTNRHWRRNSRAGPARAGRNDAWVSEEALHPASVETRDARGIEAGKGLAVGFPLPQDRDPGEPGLGAFEYQELEQLLIVVNRDTPLLVVVADVERIRSAPPTASHRTRHGGSIEPAAAPAKLARSAGTR